MTPARAFKTGANFSEKRVIDKNQRKALLQSVECIEKPFQTHNSEIKESPADLVKIPVSPLFFPLRYCGMIL